MKRKLGYVGHTNMFIIGYAPDKKYVVKRHCCHKFFVITHEQLISIIRASKKSGEPTICPTCSRKFRRRKGYVEEPEVQYVSWEKPPSVKSGYWLWKDYG